MAEDPDPGLGGLGGYQPGNGNERIQRILRHWGSELRIRVRGCEREVGLSSVVVRVGFGFFLVRVLGEEVLLVC